MSKTKSGRHQLNLAEELKDVISEFSLEMQNELEVGLDKASKFLVKKLEAASPVGKTGEFQKSWEIQDKYKGVRYIGNTKVTKQNIPLSNLIEFSSKGHPFIRKTFEENKSEMINLIKGELK